MTVIPPPFDRFLAAGEDVIAARPEVDAEMIREIFREVATMLYNGLALDGLDDHDTSLVVGGLCAALVESDPSAAVRARAESALENRDGLHDPRAAAGCYLYSAAMLRL